MKTELLIILLLIALGFAGCDEDGRAAPPADPADVRLDLIARSHPLPLTSSNRVAVVGPDVACIFDSYEVVIACGDREWTSFRTFGNEGRGPGELLAGSIVPGRAGTLWFVDMRQRRLSQFTPDGAFLGSAPMPGAVLPVGRVTDEGWFGGHHPPQPGGHGVLQVAWTSVHRDTTYHQQFRVPEAALDADGILQGLIRMPNGEAIVAVGSSRIAWFDSAGVYLGVLRVPDLEPTTPTERELAEKAEDGRRFHRLIGRPVPPDLLDPFRERLIGPRAWAPPIETLAGDDSGRLWMLSRRPSDAGTYVEVFERDGHRGAIELPGLVRSITVAGALLVALVDMEPDEFGLGRKRLDWYRIRTTEL